jgi:hypothetical protein
MLRQFPAIRLTDFVMYNVISARYSLRYVHKSDCNVPAIY